MNIATLALIGVGKWGRNYLKTAQDIPGATIKYICDSSPKVLKEFPNNYVKIRDYKQLVRYNDINGVIIATPASTHFKIIKELVSKNKNLLVEKPFVSTYSEARNVQKILLNKNSTFMVGHTYLYNPAFNTVLALKQKIGKIRYIEFEFCDNTSIAPDVSALWAWAPHPISMGITILNNKPTGVYAWYIQIQKKTQFFPETIYSKLNFSNGVCVYMKIGWLSSIKKRTCMIIGTKGSLIFDDIAERKVALNTMNGETTYPYYSKKNSLEVELEEFIRCFKKNDKPKTDIINGLGVTKIIHSIEKALLSGTRQMF